MKARVLIKMSLGTAAILILGWLAWRFETRWLRPPPPDVNPWFPMRVGDRWTYRDSSKERVIFEVLAREESPEGSFFRVERRIGAERVGFDVSVTSEGCWILKAGGDAFSPPFQEFRFPPVAGDRWSFDGTLGSEKVTTKSEVLDVTGNRCRIFEGISYPRGTTFVLEKGKGVVELDGKELDPHGKARYFRWRLEEFRRRS